MWLQESNPLACPHREGQGVKYKPKKDGPVINAQAILRKLGSGKPDVNSDTGSGSAPEQTSARN
jgi:hypothetical protein